MKDGLSGQHSPVDAVIAAVRKWVASTGADIQERSDLFMANENE
jgi:hypothetical protein